MARYHRPNPLRDHRLVGTHSLRELKVRTEIDRAQRNGQPIRVWTLGQLTENDRIGNGDVMGTRGTQVLNPQATCWCERTIVAVTWDDIYTGQTGTCGHPDCARLAARDAARRAS